MRAERKKMPDQSLMSAEAIKSTVRHSKRCIPPLLDFDAGWIVKTSTIHKVSPD